MTSAKRPAFEDAESFRLSRSMIAQDPSHRYLLVDPPSPPSMPPPTRRRVNPDALSMRLGRELVVELESFLKPGVIEMPSFAIRQEIQMRYKVDRRHIYDWFHSKGLRVTKGDDRATHALKTNTMRLTRERSSAQSTKARLRLHKGGVGSSRSLPTSSLPDIPMATPTITPDYTAPSAWSSESVGQLMTRMNRVINSRPPPGSSRTLRDTHVDNICSITANVTLDYSGRNAYYDTLSRIIGPADGIQECIGTYDAYMAKQSELYYDRILPRSLPVSSGLESSSACDPTEIFRTLNPGPNGTMEAKTSSLNILKDESALSNCITTRWAAPLDLRDIIVAPMLEDYPPRPPRAKTVSFALDGRETLSSSSLDVSPAKGSSYNQASSSLAGALGDDCPPFLMFRTDQDSRSKIKEWNRPRMGRPRAYSGGGGI